MPTRCLNKVMLIGNLTRDPELRYTPGGMAVASFGVATNRAWTTKQGEKKEDAQFHRIVAWNKLAELCSQLLGKGSRVYVEGRLQYREWVGQDSQKRQVSEIVISDMVILSPTRSGSDVDMEVADTSGVEDIIIPDEEMDMGNLEEPAHVTETPKTSETSQDSGDVTDKSGQKTEEDMPF